MREMGLDITIILWRKTVAHASSAVERDACAVGDSFASTAVGGRDKALVVAGEGATIHMQTETKKRVKDDEIFLQSLTFSRREFQLAPGRSGSLTKLTSSSVTGVVAGAGCW